MQGSSLSEHFATFRRLRRFSVGERLLLILGLQLLALMVVAGILAREQFNSLRQTQSQAAGLAHVSALRELLLDTGEWAAGRDDVRERLSQHQHAVRGHTDALQSQIDRYVSSDEVGDRLAQLLSADAAGRGSAALALLRAGREATLSAANASGMVLDAELPSYYTMSLVAMRYPELVQAVSASSQMLRKAAEAGVPDTEVRVRLLTMEGRLEALAQGIAADHAQAMAADASLRRSLTERLSAMEAALEEYRWAAARMAEPGLTGRDVVVSVAEVAQASEIALMTELRRSWQVAQEELQRLYAQRMAESRHAIAAQFAAVALALLLATWGGRRVARSISEPLSQLSTVVTQVQRTGDHALRADAAGSDDTARLADAFNGMLTQLDAQRAVQTELAASAGAAQAQNELLLATPMPLMVTRWPGDDVLHVNPPARAWVGSHAANPWEAALLPPARQRLFDALQAEGRVDEFEVQWQVDGETARWALLSARLMNYQGQPALLTMITPIQRIKRLERRLALWAQVYEASSEAVLIFDVQRSLVSVNRAFTQRTGAAAEDVMGANESELLLAGDFNPLPHAVWEEVARAGHWQGELWVQRQQGGSYPALAIIHAARTGEAEGAALTHFIVSAVDISERKQQEARIRHLAEHDALTGLPNRSLCTERLRLALQQARRRNHPLALMFLDLDRFKDINDSLGHAFGDGLLRSVAQRLSACVREVDTVSRLGGDEFVVVLSEVTSAQEVMQVVHDRLIPEIRAPHVVQGRALQVSCSVGIALFPQDGEDVDTLMRHADAAMYQAKAAGKDGARFFSAEMTARAQQRLALENALRGALERQELHMAWQPKVCARTGALKGVEGLLRWQHPQLGAVSPAEFIPVAEETGLIVPMGAWVFEQACRLSAEWVARGLPPIGISVNLSARQLRDAELVSSLERAISLYQPPRHSIELELTESMVMGDGEGHLRQMHSLRELGLALSIDDFGTGYSSLAYLSRFPIDKLKIDRSFVKDMVHDGARRTITTAIVKLGHALGLQVVGEGIETEQQANLLREAGCDELQGFLFAKPMGEAQLHAWAAARREISAVMASAAARASKP
jgi:diguanylate cyclase (GGDEF)-like protein/PAS domain S-box-containing protein